MNETLLNWIVFIAAFSGMIVIHEIGHFAAARLVGVEVEEFGIGLPTPGAITLFTWRGTRVTLNWLLIGGFVRPKGENDPNVPGGLAAAAPWKRLFVLSAGPLMNLLTAFAVYTFIVSSVGAYDFEKVLVTSVFPDSPAAQAGLEEGDIFISGNGQAIKSYEDLSEIVASNEGRAVDFLIDRNGQQVSLLITPRLVEDENRIMIGVGLSLPYTQTDSLLEDVQWGVKYTNLNVYTLLSLPAKIIRGSLPAEQTRLIGLKGIYDIMGQSIEQGIEASEAAPPSQPFYWYIPVLEIVATLSVSLGIFNLFPFPALDGGRILFVLPEMLFRRRVPHQFENLVHGLGMTFLLALMLYVNVRDFIDPITTSFP
jgi:regulator of sigma E protease